jgi:hypothetical protein
VVVNYVVDPESAEAVAEKLILWQRGHRLKADAVMKLK